jgi:RND family efflux transporter MFP subunit
MNRFLYAGVTTALVVGALFLGSRYGQRRAASTSSSSARKILYYVDPMNPSHTSPQPGLAPCGMKMEPVYAEESTATPGQLSLASLPPGSVRITSGRQQLSGVQIGKVERKPLHYTKRLLGRVAVDETRVYWINATVDGWITKALPFATGDYVRSNQALAAFYSPEFLAAGNALLFALNAQDRAKSAGPAVAATDSRLQQFNRNLQQYADALKNLGMGDPQIQEMIESRQFRQNVDIIAPADGFLLSRNVSEGLRFEKGTELYRIADLKRVWILADVFEHEAEIIQPGREVRVSWPQQHRTFTARISAALPRFDTASRTLKLRLEMDNPDYVLQPDMFVDLEFPVESPECLFVAADAVFDTGQSRSVFVELGNGYFEPRLVKTGRRFGDEVEILHGLESGESIVVAGAFLLDSESRMKLAAAGVHGTPAVDPVCGMKVEEAKARAAGRVAQKDGKTWYFCNDGCKEEFLEKEHERKEAKPAMAPAEGTATAPAAPATDPVCGMQVVIAEARAGERYIEKDGKTWYFCNSACKAAFAARPDKFTNEPGK